MLCNRRLVLTAPLARYSYQKCRQEELSAGFPTTTYKQTKKN